MSRHIGNYTLEDSLSVDSVAYVLHEPSSSSVKVTQEAEGLTMSVSGARVPSKNMEKY